MAIERLHEKVFFSCFVFMFLKSDSSVFGTLELCVHYHAIFSIDFMQFHTYNIRFIFVVVDVIAI